jgi:hypothetical protein
MGQRNRMRTPRFYFALPRLVAALCGGSAERTEANWAEANIVGTMVHAVVYLFFARRALSGLVVWQQIALLLPVALLVWIVWLIFFYVCSVLIKAARSMAILRDVTNAHAQSVLVGLMTTAFAVDLFFADATRVIGAIWLLAVTVNLLAAALLALRVHADRAAIL